MADRSYHRVYKAEHKKEYFVYRRDTARQSTAYFRAIKLERGCEFCGYNSCAQALAFHHSDPGSKFRQVPSLGARSFRVLKAEIAKCQILCRNCHAELEWGRRPAPKEPITPQAKGVARNRAFTWALKLRKGCGVCSYNACPGALDFHHRDPSTKRAEVSMLTKYAYSLQVLETEIAKCDLLCKNCHAELEAQERKHVDFSVLPLDLGGGRIQLTLPSPFVQRSSYVPAGRAQYSTA